MQLKFVRRRIQASDFGEVGLVGDADGGRDEPGEAAPPRREAQKPAKHSRRENLEPTRSVVEIEFIIEIIIETNSSFCWLLGFN